MRPPCPQATLSSRVALVRRPLAIGLAAAGLAVATPALAATTNVPALFASQIAAVKQDASAPAILLPTTMPIGFVGKHAPQHIHLYEEGAPKGASYYFQVGAAPNCAGADACAVASFGAKAGGKILQG